MHVIVMCEAPVSVYILSISADKPPKLEMPNPVLTEQYELMEVRK